MKKNICIILITLLAISIVVITGAFRRLDKKDNVWENTLNTPTQITKIDNKYFIVDCYHNRVIYNDNLKDKLSKWKTLTHTNKGHSLASNGKVLLHDDTDNNSIMIFSKDKNNDYFLSQTLEGITGRPHYIIYDKSSDYFFVLSSGEAKFYVLKDNDGTVSIVDSFVIENDVGSYERSFNIIDGYIYLVSGDGNIYKILYNNPGYKIIDFFKVPDFMLGMNFIEKIDDYYYLSSTQNSVGDVAPTFIRTQDLSRLCDGYYEDLYKQFKFNCTPYYMSKFDGKYFITEIGTTYNTVRSFKSKNNKISNINILYEFDEATEVK